MELEDETVEVLMLGPEISVVLLREMVLAELQVVMEVEILTEAVQVDALTAHQGEVVSMEVTVRGDQVVLAIEEAAVGSLVNVGRLSIAMEIAHSEKKEEVVASKIDLTTEEVVDMMTDVHQWVTDVV